jgi:hypothetical protein
LAAEFKAAPGSVLAKIARQAIGDRDVARACAAKSSNAEGNEMPDRGVIIAAVGLVIVVLSSVGGLVGRLSHRARAAR